MKNTLNKLITKLQSYSQLVLSGALIFGLFQFPLALQTQPSILTLPKDAALTQLSDTSAITTPLKDIFLGQGNPKADSIIEGQMSFVSSRQAFPASLAVIEKHAATIESIADEKGVPQDVALGVSLLENGGSDTAKSPAGALGVFQLMPGTARNLGLTVNKKVDDRRNPELNIEAGITYLKENFDRFGDWGLATWAYHAGEGNVAKALTLYAKAKSGISLAKGDYTAMKQYVASHNLTIDELLSNSAVKTLTSKLSDDSAGYPYKVLATATLFKQAQDGVSFR